MIADKHLKILESSLKAMGYRVVDWGNPSGTGYRPTVINLKGNQNDNCVIYPLSHNKVVIYDYAQQVYESLVVDLKTNSVDQEHDSKEFREKMNSIREEKKQKFIQKYNSITNKKWNDQECSVAKLKKVIIKNAFSVGSDLYVPMFSGKEVVGCQVRTETSKKSMYGSRIGGAYNILQEGTYDPLFGGRIGYVSESYTTACEIAEAVPEAFVACTAGMQVLLKGYRNLKEEYPDTSFILVLDKTQGNKKNQGQNQLEGRVAEETLPYIQLSKVDPELLDMTDFNDYALKYGKLEVKKYIDQLSASHSPLPPEMVSETSTHITVVSRIDGLLHKIPKNPKDILKALPKLAGTMFWNHLFSLYKGEEEMAIEAWLTQSRARNSVAVPKGLGIFKEKDVIIGNLTTGRYIVNGAGVETTTNMKPLSSQIYISKSDPTTTVDISKDKRPLLGLWTTLQEEWSKVIGEDISLLLGLIGWVHQGAYTNFEDFRCNAWITGSSGTGKSCITVKLLPEMFKGIAAPFTDVTPAGLSQRMTEDDGVSNFPVFMLDELGDADIGRMNKMRDIVDLVRKTATSSDSMASLRGTQDHKGRTFHKRSAVMLNSKECILTDLQDISRFLLFQMKHSVKTHSPQAFEKLLNAGADINHAMMHNMLLQAKHWSKYLQESYDFLTSYLGDRKVYSHMSRTLTFVIAGCIVFLKGVYGNEYRERILKSSISPFLDDVLHMHQEVCFRGDETLSRIWTYEFKYEGFTAPLLEFLSSEEPNQHIWRDFGIRRLGNRIQIQDNEVQIKRIFNRYHATEKIPNIYGKLMDLRATGAVGYEKRMNVRTPRGPRKMNCFLIEIPEDYQ